VSTWNRSPVECRHKVIRKRHSLTRTREQFEGLAC
jgi:hypothetical protein